MKKRQIRQLEMLVRVRDFGATHGHRFPQASLANASFQSITDMVQELNDHAVVQLALRREGAVARTAARAALLDMLDAISRTARVIQHEDPSFPNTFLMPDRESAQAVLTAAKLFDRDIEPVAARFIAHAMTETFVADLRRSIATYDAEIRDFGNSRGQSAAARESIEELLASGLALARKLDVIVANRLGHDATVLAEWRRIRLIGPRQLTKPDIASLPPPYDSPRADDGDEQAA